MDSTSVEIMSLPGALVMAMVFMALSANSVAYLFTDVEGSTHIAVRANLVAAVLTTVLVVSLVSSEPITSPEFTRIIALIILLVTVTAVVFKGVRTKLEAEAAEVAARDRADMGFN
jgi:Kef-type K+ transport system membrane component KefB